jgi:pimeloyl-ACP methyl ester carboxylesterase
MRAKLPNGDGLVTRDGVKLAYEIYGDAPDTMLFIPPWSIVHSRIYKAQLPYFSERFRCITYDGRGNGNSDRPEDIAAYTLDNYLADALAVMDALDVGQAILVGLSFGGLLASVLAAYHPERVRAAILAGTITTIGPPQYARFDAAHFTAKRDSYEGWDKFNGGYWLKNYPDFAEFFIRNLCNEPHSTKQIEDGIGWGHRDQWTDIAQDGGSARHSARVRRQRSNAPQDPLSGAVHPRRQRPDPAPRTRGGRARRGERLGVRHDRRRRS